MWRRKVLIAAIERQTREIAAVADLKLPFPLERLADDQILKLPIDKKTLEKISSASAQLETFATWNNTLAENWRLYTRALERLYEAAPKLRTFFVDGGHAYRPRNGVSRRVWRVSFAFLSSMQINDQ